MIANGNFAIPIKFSSPCFSFVGQERFKPNSMLVFDRGLCLVQTMFCVLGLDAIIQQTQVVAQKIMLFHNVMSILGPETLQSASRKPESNQ